VEDAISKPEKHKSLWQMSSCNLTGNICSVHHVPAQNYSMVDDMELLNRKMLMVLSKKQRHKASPSALTVMLHKLVARLVSVMLVKPVVSYVRPVIKITT
jgi:hypothetical protein